MVTRFIDVKLSFVENAKKKVKNRQTWLIIPSKCVHQISETNILVYCTNFALYYTHEYHVTVKICRFGQFPKCGKNENLAYFEAVFDNFCNGVQKTTDMNITSNMSSVGKIKNWMEKFFIKSQRQG